MELDTLNINKRFFTLLYKPPASHASKITLRDLQIQHCLKYLLYGNPRNDSI